jgi:hypothetical protein
MDFDREEMLLDLISTSDEPYAVASKLGAKAIGTAEPQIHVNGSFKRTDWVEGYWYYKDVHAKFPKPVAHSNTWEGQESWLALLTRVENKIRPHDQHNPGTSSNEAVTRYAFHTYGAPSFCRLCSKENGASEYQIVTAGTRYRWPDGFRHYVKTHNVMPSRQFHTFIKSLAVMNW